MTYGLINVYHRVYLTEAPSMGVKSQEQKSFLEIERTRLRQVSQEFDATSNRLKAEVGPWDEFNDGRATRRITYDGDNLKPSIVMASIRGHCARKMASLNGIVQVCALDIERDDLSY